ncbi:hypothetical protein L6164_001083 [Bauhinia variegata]|uniref:Uncharacterized protein n=1 Tax=Bauhinia variegata TaxID=167791 RepID=A0ACB9Q811_BAUVA|nr:hypothetical protein L6164_001083 [Bauhinia variegata]
MNQFARQKQFQQTSSLGNPAKAAGGIIGNDIGRWMTGFMGYMGVTTDIHVELKSLRQGLTLAWEKGVKLLEVNADSMDIISLATTNAEFHRYGAKIEDIGSLLGREWQGKLEHSYGESNQ